MQTWSLVGSSLYHSSSTVSIVWEEVCDRWADECCVPVKLGCSWALWRLPLLLALGRQVQTWFGASRGHIERPCLRNKALVYKISYWARLAPFKTNLESRELQRCLQSWNKVLWIQVSSMLCEVSLLDLLKLASSRAFWVCVGGVSCSWQWLWLYDRLASCVLRSQACPTTLGLRGTGDQIHGSGQTIKWATSLSPYWFCCCCCLVL